MHRTKLSIYSIYFILASLLYSNLSLASPEYISINSRKNIQQPFLLYPVDAPIATVILFAGGDGYLNMGEDGSINRLRNNFLLRSVPLFLESNLRVVVFEVPSHKANKDGLLYGYRGSKKHAKDVGVIIEHLKEKYDEPIWLVGTSRGTSSATNAAIRLDSLIDGLILTAPMTKENKKGTYVTAMKLKSIKIPVFIAAHKEDGCWVTPPSGIKRIERKLKNAVIVETHLFDQAIAGSLGRECGGLSAHGFLGIESSVIKEITRFITVSKV
jgi:pimeloyl-ACP methyl ester carboxylesterase